MKLTPHFQNVLRVWAALNAVCLLGLGGVLLRRWSVALSWAALAELLAFLIALLASYLEERHERQLVRAEKHALTVAKTRRGMGM